MKDKQNTVPLQQISANHVTNQKNDINNNLEISQKKPQTVLQKIAEQVQIKVYDQQNQFYVYHHQNQDTLLPQEKDPMLEVMGGYDQDNLCG